MNYKYPILKTEKSFRCRGSLWQYVAKSELGEKYICIFRDVSRSMLEKYGQVASSIDVEPKEIPKKYVELVESQVYSDLF